MLLDEFGIELKLQTNRMTVLPGEASSQQIEITNSTPFPANFNLKVEGLPADWYTFSKSQTNLAPGWNEEIDFRVEVSAKVKPGIYTGRVVVMADDRPGTLGEMSVEVEVLSPLKLAARLQPHRARGFRASYSLFVCNQSGCNAELSARLTPTNPYCKALFKSKSDHLKLPAGQSASLSFKLGYTGKVPPEQLNTLQTFEVEIFSQWELGQRFTQTTSLVIDGEYLYTSRLETLKKLPRLVYVLLTLIVLYMLWVFVVLPLIQGLLLGVVERETFAPDISNGAIRIEQTQLNDFIQNKKVFNTQTSLDSLIKIEVKFFEPTQVTQIKLTKSIWNDALNGCLRVNESGALIFLPLENEEKKKLKSFPWILSPPDKVVERLNGSLQNSLNSLKDQSKPKYLKEADIEGNSLYLRLSYDTKPSSSSKPLPSSTCEEWVKRPDQPTH